MKDAIASSAVPARKSDGNSVDNELPAGAVSPASSSAPSAPAAASSPRCRPRSHHQCLLLQNQANRREILKFPAQLRGQGRNSLRRANRLRNLIPAVAVAVAAARRNREVLRRARSRARRSREVELAADRRPKKTAARARNHTRNASTAVEASERAAVLRALLLQLTKTMRMRSNFALFAAD